jgi:hypothetical protein
VDYCSLARHQNELLQVRGGSPTCSEFVGICAGNFGTECDLRPTASAFACRRLQHFAECARGWRQLPRLAVAGDRAGGCGGRHAEADRDVRVPLHDNGAGGVHPLAADVAVLIKQLSQRWPPAAAVLQRGTGPDWCGPRRTR